MALFLVTPPGVEPLTLAEAKRHCRVDVDDDNALLDTLIQAARSYCESFTHRGFIRQVWDDKDDGFSCGAWYLPLAPVISVTSITYTATDGTATAWGSSAYETDLPTGDYARRGRIQPAYGQSYPATRDVVNAVTTRFVVGYGTTAASVPAMIVAAMKLLIFHWYEQRSAVNVGNIVTPVPLTVESLLWPFKSF